MMFRNAQSGDRRGLPRQRRLRLTQGMSRVHPAPMQSSKIAECARSWLGTCRSDGYLVGARGDGGVEHGHFHVLSTSPDNQHDLVDAAADLEPRRGTSEV